MADDTVIVIETAAETITTVVPGTLSGEVATPQVIESQGSAGSGDVNGPSTHGGNKLPLWDGVNTRRLKEGLGGSITGDIIRWNASTGTWEVKAEPLAFQEIVLTPSVEALLAVEGGLWYKSTDKSVYVCTDI